MNEKKTKCYVCDKKRNCYEEPSGVYVCSECKKEDDFNRKIQSNLTN